MLPLSLTRSHSWPNIVPLEPQLFGSSYKGFIVWYPRVALLAAILSRPQCVNTLRPRQNGRHFPDDIFKWIFLNENAWISIEISLKFVPKGSINNDPALFRIMAWRRPGDKPLSEPMMIRLPTHICQNDVATTFVAILPMVGSVTADAQRVMLSLRVALWIFKYSKQ